MTTSIRCTVCNHGTCGNHAGFGSYGAQSGDGEASISSDEQIRSTAERMAEFVK